MAIATGQFTIIDYNDALTLNGFIGSSLAKTQVYNPDNGAYSPNWTSTFLVLTPSLYKLGLTTDMITDAAVTAVQWYELVSGVETLIAATGTRVYSGTKSHILTIKANELAGISSKDYICKITYHDDTTGLDLIHKMSISFSRVINGGGIADAIAMAPDGNVFKNGNVTSLTAKVELWRGSVVDTTSVAYQWYKQDSTVVADQGGGIGWKKLTDDATLYTGTTGAVLTILPKAVASFAVFKVSIKDTDTASNTYNSFFWDTISFIDNSDPLQILIHSTGGDVFKNGVGTTRLTAKVYQAGTEIDTGATKYTYKWYKYDKDGALVTNFGGTGISFKSGKTLDLTGADVDVKGTFSVEIE